MALYDYRSVDATGKVSQGRMPAQNERELEGRLRNSGQELISATERRQQLSSLRNRRVPRRELINFCFHMEQTLRGGLMLPDALLDLIEGVTHAAFRDVLTVLLESVREGSSMSAAMQAFPNVFDEVFTGLIFAGEASGQMPEAFQRIGARLRWIDELNGQIKKMLMYPAFTLTVLAGATLFMLLYLVPQLSGFIREATGGELPLQTQLLLALSSGLQTWWPVLLIAPPSVALVGWLWLRAAGEATLLKLDRLKLRLPLVGNVIEKVVLSRFTSLFGLLYASGIPVLQSLQVCRNAAGNRWIATGIQRVNDEVVAGRPLTEAFTHVGIFPTIVLRMVRIGESTGELDKALNNVSYFFNREIEERIGRIQALVEPMLTLALGVLLGWLMMAVLGPIYDTLTKIKF